MAEREVMSNGFDLASRKRPWGEGLCEETRTAVMEMERKVSFIEREHNELQKEFDMLKLIMNPGQMEKIMVKLESEVASSCLDDSDDVELILPVSDGEDSCGGDAKRICLVSDETIEPNINGDMEVLFSRAPATADFPHARSECYRNRFDKVAADDNTNAMFCSKCFCFICDRLASECRSWETGVNKHCNAHKNKFWTRFRGLMKVIVVQTLEDEITTAEIDKVCSGMDSIHSIQDMARNCGKAGPHQTYVNLGCDCGCHVGHWSSHCTYCSDRHPTSQRLFQVLESGSASVQSQITESCFNSAAVLLHSIIAALLSNLETFKAAGFLKRFSYSNAPYLAKLSNQLGQLQDGLQVKATLWSKISENLRSRLADCTELRLKNELERALNVRSSSAAHLQDVFDGTLPAGIQFGEHSNAIVVNVLQLAAKNKYLELCRYAMCTCPTTSCVATLASEVTAFIGLRMCIPFALAKLNYPMQAIHMLYHPFKQHLPRALYDLVKVRVSDAAADQSGVAEDTLYSCQTAMSGGCEMAHISDDACPIFNKVYGYGYGYLVGPRAVQLELYKILPTLPADLSAAAAAMASCAEISVADSASEPNSEKSNGTPVMNACPGSCDEPTGYNSRPDVHAKFPVYKDFDRLALSEAIVGLLATQARKKKDSSDAHDKIYLDLSELWQPLVDFSQLPETIDVDYHRFSRLSSGIWDTIFSTRRKIRPGHLESLRVELEFPNKQAFLLESIAAIDYGITISWHTSQFKDKLTWLSALTYITSVQGRLHCSLPRLPHQVRAADHFLEHYLPNAGLRNSMRKDFLLLLRSESPLKPVREILVAMIGCVKTGNVEACPGDVQWDQFVGQCISRLLKELFEREKYTYSKYHKVSNEDMAECVESVKKACEGLDSPHLSVALVDFKMHEHEFCSSPTVDNLRSLRKIFKDEVEYQAKAKEVIATCRNRFDFVRSEHQDRCCILAQTCFEEGFLEGAVAVLLLWRGETWQEHLIRVAVSAMDANCKKDDSDAFITILKPFIAHVTHLHWLKARPFPQLTNRHVTLLLDAVKKNFESSLGEILQCAFFMTAKECDKVRADHQYRTAISAWSKTMKERYSLYGLSKDWPVHFRGFLAKIKKAAVKKSASAGGGFV